MNHTKYIFQSKTSFSYEFESLGQKGIIKKVVEFRETGYEDIFNLAFGDFDHVTGNIDDLSVSNNGDTQQILATVAAIVYRFTEQHPIARVAASGSTQARTRLYQMAISANLAEITKEFDIFGYTSEGAWEVFEKDSDYAAFFLTRKQNNIHL